MLILILIDVQYSQKTVFHFKKGSNGQNHSFSGPHHPVPPPGNFQSPPPPNGAGFFLLGKIRPHWGGIGNFCYLENPATPKMKMNHQFLQEIKLIKKTLIDLEHLELLLENNDDVRHEV